MGSELHEDTSSGKRIIAGARTRCDKGATSTGKGELNTLANLPYLEKC
jgi:hypothetical protein